ncbi:retropepsin-like aspartic protease [Acaryochloris sp. IP29b_bin.148]|uniref:retropepsin-like aspartic protease family protein n=1 Tax=Acaryochloris sp. IP29b_bin.148 TaxID=2969218 RepID=UPI00262B0F43|nr:retropepsin-like aspartic protease [Acaryochloris sp. IP29b_bin.148]
MKVSIPVLLFGLLLTLTPLQAGAQSSVTSLNQQLQQAVNGQNWTEAIQVINQLIQAAPGQAAQLKQYRTQLQQLQKSNFQGTPSRPANSSRTNKVGLVPIKRRSAGVAIVDVKFNNRRTFEMMVDSGASKTVITRPMAKALGINASHVVGTLRASTANGYAEFPLVYIKAMEVGGLKSYQVPVAVAGPDMQIGLLGQDFLQKYDFTFRGNQIEFHKR